MTKRTTIFITNSVRFPFGFRRIEDPKKAEGEGCVRIEIWVEVMGTERLTAALLDRLTHRVHILEANGESYRLMDAKKRMKRQAQRKGGEGLK